MYCEIYRCTMSEIACITRQGNAKAGGNPNPRYDKPGSTDYNCKACAQGRGVMEEFAKGKEAPVDSELTSVDSELTSAAVCKRGAVCVVGNVPQPVGPAFSKNPRLKSGHDPICKKCRNKDTSERRKTKRLRRNKMEDFKKDLNKRLDAKVELDKPAPPNILRLDFTGREKLLADLKARAEKDFRTIEAQALFYVFIGTVDAVWALPDRKAD